MRRQLLNVCLAVLVAFWTFPAWASGILTHLSGPVSVQKPNESVTIAAMGLAIEVGDVILTGPNGYVRVEMSDGSELVLRPASQLRIVTYSFAASDPAKDSFVFTMLKGGFRTITGWIGKRGNKDAYKVVTPTSTIGIRGTQYDTRVCQADCGALADGTYIAVRFGSIETSNALGSLAVGAGLVAYVSSLHAPIILPRDPGIGFTPPPAIPKLDEKKKISSGSTAPTTAVPTSPAATTTPAGDNAKSASPAVAATPVDSATTATSPAPGTECTVQ